jgi:hypothetical protein
MKTIICTLQQIVLTQSVKGERRDGRCIGEIKNTYRIMNVKLKGDHLEGPGVNRKTILK